MKFPKAAEIFVDLGLRPPAHLCKYHLEIVGKCTAFGGRDELHLATGRHVRFQ